MRYKKKPIIVDAVRWTGKNTPEVIRFCPFTVRIFDGRKISHLLIPTLEGNRPVQKGNWIIKDIIKGEFYPCKPDIFATTYERTFL